MGDIKGINDNAIYLDWAATTPPKPNVLEVIEEVMREKWGNPSSLYDIGYESRRIVNSARKTVAEYLNCEEKEVYFTSSGCEANTMAIRGYCERWGSAFLTTPIEHKSIIEAKERYNRGIFIPVKKSGEVDMYGLRAMMAAVPDWREKKPLLSIQYANNEIGVVQRIGTIAGTVSNGRWTVHTDATQMMSEKRIDVKKLGVDMLSFSGHKIGCPKGIGVLYVNQYTLINPLIYGSQEMGMRGGTENVAFIAGLEEAIKTLPPSYCKDAEKRYFKEGLEKSGVAFKPVTGNFSLSNNLSIMFNNVEGEFMVSELNRYNIFTSKGSACNNGINTPSHVLKAIGLSDDKARRVVRFSFSGGELTEKRREELDRVVDVIKGIDRMCQMMKV